MKKRFALIAMVCLVGAVLAGCVTSPTQSPETAEVVRGDLVISAAVNGNLEMPRKAGLIFGTAGVVKEITVKEGDRVVKGQILARLDAPSPEATVRMRQAEYDIAEYNLLETIYPYYTITYGTNLPGVWLALDKAQENLKEAQTLTKEGRTDEALNLLSSLEENLAEAQTDSQSRTWALPFSVKLAELQLDEAKAALDIAKAGLAEATIAAPFDGIVAGININEGQRVSSMTSANPAISLIDPSEIELNGVIDEMDISKAKLGQEVNIALDALPGREVKGKISFISPVGTVQTGVVFYKTTIALLNPGKELKDGMSATAEIAIERRENVLLITNRAIRGSLQNYWVEIVAGEQTEKRQITLGLSDGLNTEVLSGLEEGAKVVLPSASQSSFLSLGE